MKKSILAITFIVMVFFAVNAFGQSQIGFDQQVDDLVTHYGEISPVGSIIGTTLNLDDQINRVASSDENKAGFVEGGLSDNDNIVSVLSSNNITVYTLEGEYTYHSFTVYFDDGTTLTEDDVYSFSGSMTINATTGNTGNIQQTIFLNGQRMSENQDFTLIDDHTIRTSYGGCTYNLPYTFNNNYLTTTLDHICGNKFKEIDVWKKAPDEDNNVDDDGDGYTENQGDCNDSDNFIFPGAIEICDDGIDQDCNGSDLDCQSGTESKKYVYRFYRPSKGVHFYTASETEKNNVINNMGNYKYEGANFQVPMGELAGTKPIYRFFNTLTGVHFYTISENEKNRVQNNLSQFKFEGIAYYAFPRQEKGTKALYRFYNTKTSAHFYTASEEEKNNVINTLPAFKFEGIAYYIYPKTGCEGGGLPLTISDLEFPSIVNEGTNVSGSVAYRGSFNAIGNPVMMFAAEDDMNDLHTTAFFIPEPTAVNCRITFPVLISPYGIMGSKEVYFKLVDYDSARNSLENWENNSVSNIISKTVTITGLVQPKSGKWTGRTNEGEEVVSFTVSEDGDKLTNWKFCGMNCLLAGTSGIAIDIETDGSFFYECETCSIIGWDEKYEGRFMIDRICQGKNTVFNLDGELVKTFIWTAEPESLQ